MPARRIRDLIDISRIRKLADAQYELNQLPISLLDLADSTPVVNSCAPMVCAACKNAFGEVTRNCPDSLRHLSANAPPFPQEPPSRYRCKMGLWHLIAQITSSSEHIATVFSGQFFIDKDIAQHGGLSHSGLAHPAGEEAFLDALDGLPVFTHEDIQHLEDFYTSFAALISTLCEQAQLIADARNEQIDCDDYKSQLENNHFGVCRLTPPDRFLRVNAWMQRFTGYEAKELVQGMSLSQFCANPIEHHACMKALHKQSHIQDHLMSMRKKDGSTFWGSVTASAERDEQGEVKWIDLVIQDATERKKMLDNLRELSEKDSLTQIYNRRMLFYLLESEIRKTRRYRRSLSAIMLDLDGFKRINDSFGHYAGDAVLRITAELVRSSIRASDIFGRYGGEEFLIVCPETDLTGATELAEKLRTTIEANLYPGVQSITISAGVAAFDLADNPETRFIERADEAMYAAKRAGRNCVRTEWRTPHTETA